MRQTFLHKLILVASLLLACSIGTIASNDSIPNIIKIWQIDEEYLGIDSVKFDTVLNDFQVYNPIFKNEIIPTHLGNVGLPVKSNIISDADFTSPFSYFTPYFLNHQNVKYYNTRKPLTSISYFNGGSELTKSQYININHTQNINKYFNAGFRVSLIHALGDYSHQESKNNSFGLWSSYERKQYSLFTSFNYNKFKLFDNGGFVSDSLFETNDFSDAKYIETNLTNAKSLIRNYSFSVSHGISIGGWNEKQDSILKDSFFQKVKIWHNFKYSRKSRSYLAEGDDVISYYQSVFNDSTITYDSIYFDSYYNSLSLRFIPGENMFSGISAGIFHFAQQYSNIASSKNSNNFGLVGSWTGFNSKRINWQINGKMFLVGYYGGDYTINADFKLLLTKDSLAPEIKFGGSISRKTPSYFCENYSSNHFVWNKKFRPVFSEFARGELFFPKYLFNIKAQTGLFTDYIYFDNTATPAQQNETVPFFQLFVNKDFEFWKIDIQNKFIYQKSSNEIVFAVPEISYKSVLAINGNLFKKALFIRAGFEFCYQSEYYANAFMPATGVYYTQEEKKIGNYPYINVFLNAKIQDVRLFFKYEHLNQGLLENNYYTTIHYPGKARRFTFGLSWMFYD